MANHLVDTRTGSSGVLLKANGFTRSSIGITQSLVCVCVCVCMQRGETWHHVTGDRWQTGARPDYRLSSWNNCRALKN